ncbi:hypothetical protein Barb7_02235 [Bacteroidales bacterium Barb7]|nr:hypothetical protein Barb7_02235 [Bacteroidales bacterium Barb7]
MLFGDIIDQLHNQHGLPDTGTAEQADFSPFQIRSQQIDHFDTGKKDFRGRGKIFKLGCIPVDRFRPFAADRLHSVNGLTDDVQKPSFHLIANGHGNRRPQIYHLHSA